jgi:hypothetical protein
MTFLLIILFYIGFIAVVAADNEEDDREIKRVLILVSILFAIVMIALMGDNIISHTLFALVDGVG